MKNLMKGLAVHPLFLAGLVIRVVLIFEMSPAPIDAWYAPFLDFSTRSPIVDPWSAWLNVGGGLAAFPYGYAMWLAFLPLTLVAKAAGLSLQYAYSATIVAADFALLLVLNQIVRERQRLLLAVYWLSPIVIIASYVLGFNDLIPALLLMTSIMFVRRLNLKLGRFPGGSAFSEAEHGDRATILRDLSFRESSVKATHSRIPV